MNYPVVGEIWRIFEQTLLISAKKLTEDIAKHQGADAKDLWNEVKKKVNIGIIDIELPDAPISCQYMGAPGLIHERCRVPCLLGHSACTDHIFKEVVPSASHLRPVKRVMDYKGVQYFIDERGIAIDKEGIPRGVVEEEVLYIFSKCFTDLKSNV